MDELKINIPEGYIIDKKNTNLEDGIIKFKRNEISWNKIAKHFNFKADIFLDSKDFKYFIHYKKLFYIAKYLNGDWKPESNDDLWTIYNSVGSIEFVVYKDVMPKVGTIYFKSKKDAELAIKLMGDDLKYLF